MATTRAGRPAGNIRWMLLTRQGRQRPDVASRLKAHPSRDTGNACVWCGSWGAPSPPCTTAMPPSEPSRTRTGRRNEEMLRSWCIRPEITEGFRRRITRAQRASSKGLYLIPSLGLSDENQGIGRDDGEAEVDEDYWAFRPNVPAAEMDQIELKTWMETPSACFSSDPHVNDTSATMFWGVLVGVGPHRLIHMESIW